MNKHILAKILEAERAARSKARAEANTIKVFQEARTKLKDTPHRIAGKKPTNSANAKRWRDQRNLTKAKTAPQTGEKNYYPGMGIF